MQRDVESLREIARDRLVRLATRHVRVTEPVVMAIVRLPSLLVATIVLASAACDFDARPTCEEIGEVCHSSETDPGIECHETAEDPDTTEDTCDEMKDACLAECQ